MRRPGSPVELSVFRLGADGRYAPVPPSQPPVGAGDRWEVPVYGGGAQGRPFRLRPEAYEPRFQWWDAAQGRWRDPESDAAHEWQVERDHHVRERQVDRERHARELQATRVESRTEGRAEGRTEERMELAMAALHFLSGHLPSRDRIAAHWRQAGPPPDVMDRLLQVRQAPAEWRSLLRIPDANGDADSR